MITILIATISATASVAVAIIGGVFSVKQSKVQKRTEDINKKQEERAEQRKQESLLAMELSHANTKLTVGVAMALKRGHANGEIEEGLAAVNEASENYNAYLRKVANETLHN